MREKENRGRDVFIIILIVIMIVMRVYIVGLS